MDTRIEIPGRVPVKAVEEYTYTEMVAHLHDYHGLNAEDQAEDEESNGTDEEVVAEIRAMTREEAIMRLPGHYFQSFDLPFECCCSLASALLVHEQQHADNPGGYGRVHFHPGRGRW